MIVLQPSLSKVNVYVMYAFDGYFQLIDIDCMNMKKLRIASTFLFKGHKGRSLAGQRHPLQLRHLRGTTC